MLKRFEYRKTGRKRRKSTLKNKRLPSQFNNFFISKAYETFTRLKNIFLTTFVFMHFNSSKFIRVKIDVLNKALEVIFCQQNKDDY